MQIWLEWIPLALGIAGALLMAVACADAIYRAISSRERR